MQTQPTRIKLSTAKLKDYFTDAERATIRHYFHHIWEGTAQDLNEGKPMKRRDFIDVMLDLSASKGWPPRAEQAEVMARFNALDFDTMTRLMRTLFTDTTY